MAVCRIDQRNELIKILGTCVSYNNEIKVASNFLKVGSNVKTVLKLWRFWNLTLEQRIVVFKSLSISKTVFQALIATIPSHIFKALETIQTPFLWNNTNPKLKHKTIIKNFREWGLKNADIRNKLTSIHISYEKRLYNDCFHQWKIISLRNGVLHVLEWVAWVARLPGWRASMGGVGGVLEWVACKSGWRGWHARVGSGLARVVC